MGQKDGEKWIAAALLPPALDQSDRLLCVVRSVALALLVTASVGGVEWLYRLRAFGGPDTNLAASGWTVGLGLVGLLGVVGLGLWWYHKSGGRPEAFCLDKQGRVESMAAPLIDVGHTGPGLHGSNALPGSPWKNSANSGQSTVTENRTRECLSAQDLHLRLGGVSILRGLSLRLAVGEKVALIGPNGAGKTSLFQVLGGQLRSDAGRVHLHGRDTTHQGVHAVARAGLARSFQVPQLMPPQTVEQHLACAVLAGQNAGWQKPWRSVAMQQAVAHWAKELDLDDKLGVEARHLSYAEQRRLDVGLALASAAPLVLLDEPTAGLSRSETQALTERLGPWLEGRTLLMVEHDMEVVFGLADRVVVVVEGQVLADGPAQTVRNDPRVQAAYLGNLSFLGHLGGATPESAASGLAGVGAGASALGVRA